MRNGMVTAVLFVMIFLAACADGGNSTIIVDCEDSPTGNGGPMCVIPAGKFLMGCNESVDVECHGDEYPYHSVMLDVYRIDKYEVTAGEYRKCIDAGACTNDGEHIQYLSHNDNSSCNLDAEGKEKYPMQCVTWYGANAYCAWLGRRLPTEAEWEKAARGVDGRRYPWGNEPIVSCDYAVIYDEKEGGYGCGSGGTMPVGSKPNGVSPYGVHDMIGNVWEWVNDWWASGYYASSPKKDPPGPENGQVRVLRGGAWHYGATELLRASCRSNDFPDSVTYCLDDGFRCAE